MVEQALCLRVGTEVVHILSEIFSQRILPLLDRACSKLTLDIERAHVAYLTRSGEGLDVEERVHLAPLK